MTDAPHYRLTVLGTLFGIGSSGSAINDAGRVAGFAQVNDGSAEVSTGYRAFVYTGPAGKRGMTFDLGSLAPGEDSDVCCIDAAGRVSGRSGNRTYVYVGTPGANGEMRELQGMSTLNAVNNGESFVGQATIDGVTQAAVYTGLPGEGGQLFGLGVLAKGLASEAVAINDSGRIIGNSPVGQGNEAFVYVGHPGEGGTMHGLGKMGQEFSIALDVNEAGDIVGTAGETAFLYRGTPGEGGHAEDIGGFIASPSVSANFINNAGVVAGSAQVPDKNERHSYIFVESGWIDLGTLGGPLSGPAGLNDQGTVIGIAQDAEGMRQPFVSVDFQPMVNLNTRIVDPGEWVLTDVTALNASGQIVGTAHRTGTPPFETHAVVLTPVTD